ncbi:hypothetical protein OG729_13875 [Streptomyces sp. NBC_00210]
MSEIDEGEHVTCVKQYSPPLLRAAAKYRRRIAELSGFARARCASDAD